MITDDHQLQIDAQDFFFSLTDSNFQTTDIMGIF